MYSPFTLNAPQAIGFCSLIAVCCIGCGSSTPAPGREELAAILGKLDESVIVLGGRSVPAENTSSADLSDSTQTDPAGGKLWIVSSHNELPCPYSRDAVAIAAMKAAPEPKILVELNAFPARVAYDIAAELQISTQSIQLPKSGDLLTAKGRMCEWSVNEKQIRVRDFPTTDGWLSVVEVFQEPIK